MESRSSQECCGAMVSGVEMCVPQIFSRCWINFNCMTFLGQVMISVAKCHFWNVFTRPQCHLWATRCVVESVPMNSIVVWYGNCSIQATKRAQNTIRDHTHNILCILFTICTFCMFCTPSSHSFPVLFFMQSLFIFYLFYCTSALYIFTFLYTCAVYILLNVCSASYSIGKSHNKVLITHK